MLKVTWTMNNGKSYESEVDGTDWTDVADLICDNDIIHVDNGGQQVVLNTRFISDVIVEGAAKKDKKYA